MSAHPYVSEWREGHLSEPCTSTTHNLQERKHEPPSRSTESAPAGAAAVASARAETAGPHAACAGQARVTPVTRWKARMK